LIEGGTSLRKFAFACAKFRFDQFVTLGGLAAGERAGEGQEEENSEPKPRREAGSALTRIVLRPAHFSLSTGH